MAWMPLLRGTILCDVASELSGAAGKLAVGYASISRHPVGGAELCIRARGQQDRRLEPAGFGLRSPASRREWRRPGQRTDLAAVHRTVRPLRLPLRSNGAGLRPC